MTLNWSLLSEELVMSKKIALRRVMSSWVERAKRSGTLSKKQFRFYCMLSTNSRTRSI